MRVVPVAAAVEAAAPAASWISKNRKTVAFIVGIVGVFLCPYLPPVVAGPCRVVATALRTGIFDGVPIPGFEAPDAGTP